MCLYTHMLTNIYGCTGVLRGTRRNFCAAAVRARSSDLAAVRLGAKAWVHILNFPSEYFYYYTPAAAAVTDTTTIRLYKLRPMNSIQLVSWVWV